MCSNHDASFSFYMIQPFFHHRSQKHACFYRIAFPPISSSISCATKLQVACKDRFFFWGGGGSFWHVNEQLASNFSGNFPCTMHAVNLFTMQGLETNLLKQFACMLFTFSLFFLSSLYIAIDHVLLFIAFICEILYFDGMD